VRSTNPRPTASLKAQPVGPTVNLSPLNRPRSSAAADYKPIKPQALSFILAYPGRRQQPGVPTINIPAAADRHQPRPRINNVNARLRQNQWPAFRVNTGEGSLILAAQDFKTEVFKLKVLKAQVFKTDVFQNRRPQPLAIESSKQDWAKHMTMRPNMQQSSRILP